MTVQPGITVPVAPVAPLAPAAPVARPKPRSSRLLDAALVLAGLIAVGGVAFGVGRATAPVAAAANGAGTFRNGNFGNGTFPGGSFDPNNAPGRGGAFGPGNGLSIDGTVTAVTADSVTLKLANGNEVTFKVDSATTYHRSTAGSSSDVAVGDSVAVKVTGNGRFFGGAGGGANGGNGGAQASPAPGASGAPGAIGNLQASDITVTH
jgi:hypothetical protein